jgi:prepilin signal peptidase PulO-like enzyme (type II secretory pathway)
LPEWFLVIFFIYGLIFGSFFNVVGLRIPKKESIVSPPSHCPHCNTRLKAVDLFPVLSYLLRRGRCGYCRAVISPVYPIIELLTGLLFAGVFYKYGFTGEMVVSILFVSLLVIITVSDMAYKIIPDKVLLPFFVTFLILRFFIHPMESYYSHLIGMVLGFTIFLLIAVISKGGMGGGDIKLFAVVGLFFGYPLLFLTILLSTLLGTMYGILLIIMKGAGRKTEIPFGPFIACASLISLFVGQQIIDWYVGMLF